MKNDYKKLVVYWQKTASHDHETMLGLFGIKRYSDSLFYGHIVLEKILKALVANITKTHAPYTHDLIGLMKIAKLGLGQEEVALLNEVNNFNIKARYPEQKLKFYKLCTKKYTEEYINGIDKLYKKLCQKLKPKK